MKDVQSDTDPRRGWFKILIPEIENVFGSLFWGEEIECEEFECDLLPFMYGRLDPDQVAFDCALSVPFLAVDRAVLVKVDDRPEAQAAVGPSGFPIQMIPLRMLAMEQVNRCYMPVTAAACIIPVDSNHPIVGMLLQITSESGLIIPQGPTISGSGGPPKIIDIARRIVDPPEKK